MLIRYYTIWQGKFGSGRCWIQLVSVFTCRYSLFASISTLLREEMSEVLEPMVTMMITSVKSTEGITVCAAASLFVFSAKVKSAEPVCMSKGRV